MEMNLQPLRVNDLFTRSLESVRGTADANGVRLRAEPSGDWVVGDPDRLVQVLVNLLSNAVRFSSRGASVTVVAAERGENVELRVSDCGRGIPADAHGALFERFQRAEASDLHEKGGTGLGFAICKATVERLGGTIGVESELGQGSTFWVRLPAAATPPSDPLLLREERTALRLGPARFLTKSRAIDRELQDVVPELLGAESAMGRAN